MGVYHDLARRTMAGIHCSVGNCLPRMALTTSFMRQVAEAYVREACAELREDGDESELMVDGRTADMEVRGMTTAEVVIGVLQETEYLMATWYERERTLC